MNVSKVLNNYASYASHKFTTSFAPWCAGYINYTDPPASDKLVQIECGVELNREFIQKILEYHLPSLQAIKDKKAPATEKQIVMDVFAGGGSTGFACIALNKQFIGIECNAKLTDYLNRVLNEEFCSSKRTMMRNSLNKSANEDVQLLYDSDHSEQRLSKCISDMS